MCGIVGIVNKDRERPVDRALLNRMRDVLAHRGPDGSGSKSWGNVGLGHRRLAILDRASGTQPMRRGLTWITYNGELYNHVELRQALGGRFRTVSDTEVALALYERHGLEMFEHMNGMFAFALFDRAARRLVLARDRFGEKPLYVFENDDVFLFASEIKALLVHPDVRAEVDPVGLDEYRSFQHTLGTRTLFEGIRKLAPGSLLVLDDAGRTLEERPYWTLPTEQEPGRPDDHELLRELVEDAVRLRMRSDARIGAYVSGGLDSSVVACMAGPVPLFSGAFADAPIYSELPYAAAVAEATGAEHHVVQPTAEDFAAQLHRIVWHLDEPAAGPGAFGQYNVAELASRHVTVALGGQGGDEIFGGYARHLIIAGSQVIPGYEELERKAYGAMVGRGERAVTLPPVYSAGGSTPLARATAWDASTQLQALLHVEDRMSMAHGLESRMPLLDHRIAELVCSRPDSFRHLGGRPKGALYAVGEGRVPRAVLERTDKRGFPVPFVEWAKGPLRNFVGDLVGGDAVDASAQFDRDLWGRLCLAVWRELFIEDRATLAAA